jgi:hypothetical protein
LRRPARMTRPSVPNPMTGDSLMRSLPILSASLLMFLLAACQTDRRRHPSEEAIAQYRQIATEYDTLAGRLAQSVPYLGAPLKTLNKQQQASVAALLILVRTAAEEQTLRPSSSRGPLATIWAELPEICPPLRSASFSRGDCFDAELAYASAMASCQREGKSDDECELLASPEAAAALSCKMKTLEKLAGIIGALPGRVWPPRPFPWPIERTAGGGRVVR